MQSQQENLNQNDYFQLQIEKQQAIDNPNFHSAVRPYKIDDLNRLYQKVEAKPEFITRDSIYNNLNNYLISLPKANLNTGLVAVDDNVELQSILYTGINLNYNLKRKLSLSGSFFYGTQSTQGWERKLRDSLSVFPNWGVAHRSGIQRSFHSFEGYVSYSPDEVFNLELGRGRHFFGDGINSLFLSSNANASPYFKLTTSVWNIKYVNLFAKQTDIRLDPFDRNAWLDKYTATHFLSWNISPQVSVGLFETIIWAAEDSLSNRGFDLNYLNPVIFYRPIEFSLGSADNAIIGFNVKYIYSEKFSFYGQWVLDEFLLSNFLNGNGWWSNKFGLQLGMNYYDAFEVQDLILKGEFNLVRPFTYSHGNVTSNYGHFNQSLAHPLGSNFYNFNFLFSYPKGDWLFEGNLIYNYFGRDSVGTNLGGNIYQSYIDPDFEFGNEIGQGVENSILDFRFKANYIFSRKYDFRLFADLSYYHVNSRSNSNNIYIRTGLRLNWPDYR